MSINFESNNLPSSSSSFQINENGIGNGQKYPTSAFSTISSTTTTTSSINFVMGNSSGDDSNSRTDDSPRKRQRKQQFDNSQQDKLMVSYT